MQKLEDLVINTYYPIRQPLRDKSALMINGFFHIAMPNKKPNIWFRFWQYLFFGFKWKDLDNG